MTFEVDRYPPTWAHIALCADLTWASEPHDDFIVANQRLLAQHCRISQILQDTRTESHCQTNQCEITEKRLENGTSSSRRSVKDIIPESRLAQFYGNFYYDEHRESCYTNPNESNRIRPYCNQGCENSDVTECWMLAEVEYWFRKLIEEPSDRSMLPRRRRQYRIPADDDFERWGPYGARTVEEANLEAKVRSVRKIWQDDSPGQCSRARAPSPPQPPRKMRARRRQPRRLSALAPPPPLYCLDAPAQLVCDPTCKFHFETPRPPQLTECQRAISRYSASMQALMRVTAARCPLYRGTNVSRYAPTGQRPLRCSDRRCSIWWPREHLSARQEQKYPKQPQPHNIVIRKTLEEKDDNDSKAEEKREENDEPLIEQKDEKQESPKNTQKEKIVEDGQVASTSSAPTENELRKKRLYSTVLSMSAPPPINITAGCIRLSQKLVTPGILKLNPKIVLQTRLRTSNVDNKFEELEKEALEQYKGSDESIDSKFQELEKEAVEQYSTSNSNTSCSSGNSAEKKASSNTDVDANKKQSQKFHKDKSVDSVVIYSQNFPDLNARGHTSSVTNLKNCHAPPRGEKKEQSHRPSKTPRNVKIDSQRAASDTDNESRNNKTNHKGAMRWTLHLMPPKKKHLSSCVSDFSSDEDLEEPPGSIKDAGPCIKHHITGKVKMSAHGAGDLHPIMRKT
ncbi:uncharacterized protein LOC119837194 [Zerene cesonia]|uniref:uncharacterized protein LOC119837194 n=1 Tax=Zerene cesonia TaxID=33412 RepID=UPI0018E5480C|nr:uncharacterized protein LOC119837194 [Zerene cesonia]